MKAAYENDHGACPENAGDYGSMSRADANACAVRRGDRSDHASADGVGHGRANAHAPAPHGGVRAHAPLKGGDKYPRP